FLGGFALAPALAATVVTQKSRSFRPGEITIARGETVTFTNEDSYIHQVYVSGLFESDERAPGENLNETFPASGTFQVRCRIHPTMKLTVRVR
ncbi:MAG TPA: plastocyanin/azurin family copper-binding protein, partial [Rhizomicrobium sp.]|nr:plastocyanin/azurin family copper-binding protein [Rhizomicrobium sp.]